MGKINIGRVAAGGLLAGLVINAGETLVNARWLGKDWEAALQALGRASAMGPAMMAMNTAWGFIMGVFVVWLYAAIRPRFGPGPRTAVIAAAAAWLPGYFLSLLPPAVMGMFPMRLMATGVVLGLVELLAGAQLGARVYREPETA